MTLIVTISQCFQILSKGKGKASAASDHACKEASAASFAIVKKEEGKRRK